MMAESQQHPQHVCENVGVDLHIILMVLYFICQVSFQAYIKTKCPKSRALDPSHQRGSCFLSSFTSKRIADPGHC